MERTLDFAEGREALRRELFQRLGFRPEWLETFFPASSYQRLPDSVVRALRAHHGGRMDFHPSYCYSYSSADSADGLAALNTGLYK